MDGVQKTRGGMREVYFHTDSSLNCYMKNISLIFVFVLFALSFVLFLLTGLQYILSLFLDVHYTHQYSSLFLSLHVCLGFLILVPVDVILEDIMRYFQGNNKKRVILSHIFQFLLFFLYMKTMVAFMNIATFDSIVSEVLLYTIMYAMFFALELIGDKVKKEDEQRFHLHK